MADMDTICDLFGDCNEEDEDDYTQKWRRPLVCIHFFFFF